MAPIRPVAPQFVAPKVESSATSAVRPGAGRGSADSFSSPRGDDRTAPPRPAASSSRTVGKGTAEGVGPVRFDDLFNESMSGPVLAGGTLRLDYDADRLRNYLGDQAARGGATFGIEAYVSFDYGTPQKVPVAGFVNGELKTHEAAIEVPADAKNVRVWFRGAGAFSDMYDSNYGANYELPVVQG